MTDPYPKDFVIEIDRDRLSTYLRVKWLLFWVAVSLIVGACAGFGEAANIVERSSVRDRPALLPLYLRNIDFGAGVGFLAGVAAYLIFSHGPAGRVARSLEVSVEGAFLRIRQRSFGSSDRKLHFRSIVDYTMAEDALMRACGVQALRMTTMASTPQQAVLTIIGIKDCLKVRDLLSEVDALREKS